jgi:Fe2+ or Zn2+ uptake regulation protein
MSSFVLDKYLEILRARKIKITAPRLAFLNAITAMNKKHFTVSEIINEIKLKEGHVNTMSVYNNLELFLKEHLLFTNVFGKHVLYELMTTKLIHVRCDYCGRLFHLDEAEKDIHQNWFELFGELTKKYNIELEHYKLEAHGMCDNCRTMQNDKWSFQNSEGDE